MPDNTRLDNIIQKLKDHAPLINNPKQGSIEINFSDTSVKVSVKVVI